MLARLPIAVVNVGRCQHCIGRGMRHPLPRTGIDATSSFRNCASDSDVVVRSLQCTASPGFPSREPRARPA
jgi:hypothetical protein